MTRINIIKEYFESSLNEKFALVIYGSGIYKNNEPHDIDVAIITEHKLNIDFSYEDYKEFLIENDILIDEEIRYEDKLFIDIDSIKSSIIYFDKNYDYSSKVDLVNNYKDAVNRLYVNIATTRTLVFGDKNIYQKISKIARENLYNKYINSTDRPSLFGFFDRYKVGKEYKNYFGYSDNVKDILKNIYYSHSNDLIIKLLSQNVLENPNKVAVLDAQREISYLEFDKITDNIAKYLSSRKESHVIVDYPHSIELLEIIYGIYKCGKIYVPVDYYAPENEKRILIDNFDDYIYISENEFKDKSKFKYVDGVFEYNNNDIAYIIHTSGTTGNPKGVMVKRDNLAYILKAIQKISPIEKNDKYLFSTRDTFDVSITEIFGFLYNSGATFVYSMKNNQFFKKLADYVDKFKITHMALSPSAFKILLKSLSKEGIEKLNANIKFYMIAGEEFRIELKSLIKEKIQNSRIINAYGPTECTVYATSYELNYDEEDVVPIGKPLDGVIVKIIEDELLIGGDGVALGYYKKEDITEEKFIYIDNERYYKTGDIVYLKDDNIVYKNRKDNQIQIRGIRVELGEIRKTIKSIIDNDDIREIEVIYENENLILIYTGSEINNFRDILKNSMSGYKIPTKFINVTHIPLTSSGKMDIKKILRDELKSNNIPVFLDSNLNKIKKIVYSYTGEIGDDEYIYEHGVDSLYGVQLICDIEKELDVDIDCSLYDIPTINKIYDKIYKFKSNYKNEVICVKNNFSRGKVLYTYPLYYYTKIYHELNFDSVIYGFINLGLDMSYEELYHKLNKIEVLHSFVNIEKGEFEYRDVPINISYKFADNVDLDIEEELINIVISNKKSGNYLYKMFYVYNNNYAKLYYAFEHSIFDMSCETVLRKIIFDKEYENNKYSEFIKFISENNTLEIMKDNMCKYDIDSTDIKEIIYSLPDDTDLIKLDINSVEVNDVYTKVIEYLRRSILKKVNRAKINLIYNIRDFSKAKFDYVIGDIHTGLIYIYEDNVDIEKSVKETVNRCRDTAFIPKYYGYRNFPRMTKEDIEFNRIFDDEVYISINYLGVVGREEIKGILDKYKGIKKEINKLNSCKLNISVYVSENKIYMLLSKRLKENICEK